MIKNMIYTYGHRYPRSAALHNFLQENNIPYFAKDNIHEAIQEYITHENPEAENWLTYDKVIDDLVKEATVAFRQVLFTQVIDIDNDPNSHETAHRLAKMYIRELMAGRYEPKPKVTSFPNNKKFDGLAEEEPSRSGDAEAYHFNNLLVVQAPFTSICSHHHQPVNGTAYIGIIPGKRVIGLSKYTRLAQHVASRGTLQEELTIEIADEISNASESYNVAVVTFARHGCCENRGIRVHNSQTTAAEMRGLFMEKGKLREEFYDNVKILRRESCSK